MQGFKNSKIYPHTNTDKRRNFQLCNFVVQKNGELNRRGIYYWSIILLAYEDAWNFHILKIVEFSHLHISTSYFHVCLRCQELFYMTRLVPAHDPHLVFILRAINILVYSNSFKKNRSLNTILERKRQTNKPIFNRLLYKQVMIHGCHSCWKKLKKLVCFLKKDWKS